MTDTTSRLLRRPGPHAGKACKVSIKLWCAYGGQQIGAYDATIVCEVWHEALEEHIGYMVRLPDMWLPFCGEEERFVVTKDVRIED